MIIDLSQFQGDNFPVVTELMEQRKLSNTRCLQRATGNLVQHGLLQGYQLDDNPHWLPGDQGCQLLGLYEQEVCALLWHWSASRRTLIDLGAANGIYGLGLVSTDIFDRSFCYEIDDASREMLAVRANVLGISKRVTLAGDAFTDFKSDLDEGRFDLSESVLLCDIEGGEFDLFDSTLLARLGDARIIIENHDFIRPERYEASAAFRVRAEPFFCVTEMFVGSRDLRNIPLISDHWNDSDRWLLCSEGRAKLASWFVLTPKNSGMDAGDLDDIHRSYCKKFW